MSASNKKGFSLVEVLVAILILSFITSTLWITFYGSLDTQNEIRQTDERIHEVRSSLDRISKEISMAFLSKQQSSDKRTQTIFVSEDLSDRDQITFTSFSHFRMLKDAKESDQCEISYFLEEKNDTTVLMRREDPQLDDEPKKGGLQYALLDGITSFNLRFYDARQESWVDKWDSEGRSHKDRLPAQVEIKLSYQTHRDQVFTLQTRTLIYMMDILEL